MLRVIRSSVLVAACLSGGCGEVRVLGETTRYDRASLSAALDDPTSEAGFVIGEFALSADGVVDGDTIKVEGLDASLRLLAVDTEETFKHDDEVDAYEAMSFPDYLESMRDSSGRPPKGPTPLGTDAKKFAQDFFAGVATVRLERDHPKEIRGAYNRYLTYVFANKGERWVNYNVECVRAGMSPYFTKYGYSRRFHDEFSRAQQEAQANKRGIWADGAEHYADYADRLAWWNSRAAFAAQFEAESVGRNDHIVLTNWDAMTRLEDMHGEFVSLLAVVGSASPRQGRGPARITLSRRRGQDFPVICFDDEIVRQSGLDQAVGEYVVVTGRVSKYTRKQRSRRRAPQTQLQIELKSPDQVRVSGGWAAIVASHASTQSPALEAPLPPPKASPDAAQAATNDPKPAPGAPEPSAHPPPTP